MGKSRYWAEVRGRYIEVTQAEADARGFSPADGVYDDAFHKRFRDHIDRVTRRFDGTRPCERNDDGGYQFATGPNAADGIGDHWSTIANTATYVRIGNTDG